ncbi:MAG: hypothetical protein NTW19_15635 [Planctomycetota bacterium]|nr:hypothetical protein [Planctomycetota bacterium]
MQTATPTESIEPFFFGDKAERLFGCFHPPAVVRPDLSAVLICAPVGYEGIRAHRACRQLAAQLAAAGSPTLRFDYFATGDSAGDDAQGTLARWRQDVGVALAELRLRAAGEPGRSANGRVAVVGLRLGACLAADAAAGLAGVDRFALWHPLATGKACLEHWAAVQQEYNRAMGHADEAMLGPWPAEVQGFPLTPGLVGELEQWDLSRAAWTGKERALVLAGADDKEGGRVAEELRRRNVSVETDAQAGPRFWDQEPLDTVVPFQTLRRIVAWLTGSGGGAGSGGAA